jgi:hypothetical protein
VQKERVRHGYCTALCWHSFVFTHAQYAHSAYAPSTRRIIFYHKCSDLGVALALRHQASHTLEKEKEKIAHAPGHQRRGNWTILTRINTLGFWTGGERYDQFK